MHRSDLPHNVQFSRLYFAILIAVVGAAWLVVPAAALERRSGQTVIVPKDETLDDSLVARGETVRIEGTVTGNVIAIGSRVLVTGTVRGDLISFSRSLELEGRVEGNTFSFAEEVNLRGEVANSSTVFARYCRLGRNGRIRSDLMAFCAEANLSGGVGRDVQAYAASVDVRGNIERDLVTRSDRLTLMAPARVGGDLRARVPSNDKVEIEPGATVVGQTDIRVRTRVSKYRRAGFYFEQLLRIAAAFVTGLFFFWLFPWLFRAVPGTAGDWLRNAGVGFLVCVAIPVAAVIAAITLVGIPLAVISLAAWLIGLYVSKIVVAAIVGRSLLRPQPSAPPSSRMADFAVALLVGVVVVYVAINLPFIGGIVHFLLILTGLGLAAIQVRSRWRRGEA